MPAQYKECVKSEEGRGRKHEDAQRICAISYYKQHKETPQQAEKKGKAATGETELTQWEPNELKLFEMLELVGPVLEDTVKEGGK